MLNGIIHRYLITVDCKQENILCWMGLVTDIQPHQLKHDYHSKRTYRR